MKEEIITIRYPEGEMTLVLPTMLDKLSMDRLKKVFRLILEKEFEHMENEISVRRMNEFIPEYIQYRKETWDNESLTFQREYVDPVYSGRNQKERKEIKNRNYELMRNVKTTKKKHERALKVQNAWTKLKEKYER